MQRLWDILREAGELGGNAHDLSHVRRVHKMCLHLLDYHIDADKEILTAAVILHDIARAAEDNDKSRLIDHAVLGAQQAEDILLDFGWTAQRAAHVRDCIAQHRYRSSGDAPQTIEAKLLYDADKLDSLGLIGVARSYMLAGEYGEQLHINVPAEFKKEDIGAPRVHDFAQYSVNLEYYVKLRHIPKRLFTDEARRIAEKRLKKMDEFFAGLEWELELGDV